jgi:pyrroloquinoline quinone biosynthesis protein D
MELSSIPRLAQGCRLHPTQPMLLIPEGALNLVGAARDVLMQLDGTRTIAEIVKELTLRFPEANIDEIQRDVLSFLGRFIQRGVVRV